MIKGCGAKNKLGNDKFAAERNFKICDIILQFEINFYKLFIFIIKQESVLKCLS